MSKSGPGKKPCHLSCGHTVYYRLIPLDNELLFCPTCTAESPGDVEEWREFIGPFRTRSHRCPRGRHSIRADGDLIAIDGEARCRSCREEDIARVANKKKKSMGRNRYEQPRFFRDPVPDPTGSG